MRARACVCVRCKEVIFLDIFIGLFHKAISQSGVATNPWSFNEWTSKESNKGFLLVEKCGKATTDPIVACEFLQSMDAKQLIKTARKLSSEFVSNFILFQRIKKITKN